MIPKKIHYCWFGGNPLPNDVKKCIKSWKKYAPDYEIIEWNESNFDIRQNSFVSAAYDAKAWAFVSDYARLKVIFDNGGIYFDTDVELLRTPDFLLDNEFYIGVQQAGKFCTTGLGFGAEKNNSIVKLMLDKYDDLEFLNENKKNLACPYLNNEVLTSLGYTYSDAIWRSDGVAVYPCRYFDPLAPGDTDDLLCNETVSIHHYSATWMTKSSRIKRKLINLFGQKNINRLKRLFRR